MALGRITPDENGSGYYVETSNGTIRVSTIEEAYALQAQEQGRGRPSASAGSFTGGFDPGALGRQAGEGFREEYEDPYDAPIEADKAARQGVIDRFGSRIDEYEDRNNDLLRDSSDTIDALNADDDELFQNFSGELDGVELDPLQLIDMINDPEAYAAQKQALGDLQGVGGGSLDQVSQAAQAYANPEDIRHQTMNRDKLWGLTDTEMTAEERFIMERARMQEEQDRRGAMDAAMRNLFSRGMGNSGAQIGAMLGAQQTTSQNRMLQGLGALANASRRSMAALDMHGNISTQMRNAGFDEQFKRGAAADDSNHRNSDRRVVGMQGAGAIAGDMRDSADRIAHSNAQLAQNHNIAGTQLERDLANDRFDGGRLINAGKSDREDGWTDRALTANSNNHGAARDGILLEWESVGRDWENDETKRAARTQREKDAEAAEQNRKALKELSGGVTLGPLGYFKF